MEQLFRHDRKCRVCGSEDVLTVLRLEDTPLEDQYLKTPRLQPTFPLELALCNACGYLYLPYLVSPEASYTDYLYVSSITDGLLNHYDAYAKAIIEQYQIAQGSLVVDIGSNDGSMLASFKKHGMNTVGIEPVQSAAKLANDNNLFTINDYFTDVVTDRIIGEQGQAQIITANYMYANVDDLISFTNSVARLLGDKGIFVVQTGYHPEQMKLNMFDYVYHEHFSYFTVEVIQSLFSTCGLEVIDAATFSPKGGSLRIVGQKKGGGRSVSSNVSKLIAEEKQAGMRKPEMYIEFGKKIDSLKSELHEHLKHIKLRKESIVGFGASHSTTTLLYNFELHDYLDYIVDDNTLKHNTYSPGKHIPVYSSDKLYEDDINNILVLAWQHGDAIVKRHNSLIEKGSSFIIPLPSLKIIGK